MTEDEQEEAVRKVAQVIFEHTDEPMWSAIVIARAAVAALQGE